MRDAVGCGCFFGKGWEEGDKLDKNLERASVLAASI